MADVDGERDTDVTIYLERIVDRVGDYHFDPTEQYAGPQFYAYIAYLPGDVPSEVEVRLGGYTSQEMLTITPRQLNEQGDIHIPTDALLTAIQEIRKRTQESKRAIAERQQAAAEEEREEAGSSSGG